MRRIHLLAVLPLSCLFAANAFAQVCNKPLVPKNMLQMTSTDGGPSSLPVKINGTDQKLVLATAGTTTQITPDAAKTMNLDVKRGDNVLIDDFGNQHRDEATIADFTIGTMHGSNAHWPVSFGAGGRRGGGDGGDDAAAAKDQPAGLFSLNYMRLYDVDVDFGSDKLIFFSQDHCPGGVLYWKAPGAVGVVPINIDNGRVMVPVTVNGKAINAVIDTAAPNSSVRTAVATKVLGVELGGPKVTAGKPDFLGGQNYNWTADSLALGPLKLENVLITIRADINAGQGKDPAQAQRFRVSGIQAELDKPEVVIGMDTLRKLHLFLSFAENRLYVTGTTSTLPAAGATAAAAPAPAKAP